MEEVKKSTKKAQEIKEEHQVQKAQEVQKAQNLQEQKLSYEELNKTASDLYQQLQVVTQRLKQAELRIYQMSDIINKVPFLLKVVELGDKHFDSEFVLKCVEEIKSILSVGEDSDSEGGSGDEEAQ